MPKFEPSIYFDEEEYCQTVVSDETLLCALRILGGAEKDKLLFNRIKLDDTG